MTMTEFVGVELLLVNLAGVWAASLIWRSYRRDKLRQELFELRDELFAIPKRGDIAFDDPAYYLLRSQVNRMMRYAHWLNLTRMILPVALQSIWDSTAPSTYEKWRHAVGKLESDETKQALVKLRVKMAMLIWRHMFLVSPLTVPLVVSLSFPRSRKYLEKRIDRIENEVATSESLCHAAA